MDVSDVCAVVGALAHRAAPVSRRVFVGDCGDLQILQSSDLSFPPHRLPGLRCWISKWAGCPELEVLFSLPVFWFHGHVHIVGLLNPSSPQRCHHCDGVGVQDLFYHGWVEDTSAEEESSQREERLICISWIHLEDFLGQISSCDSERISSGVEFITGIMFVMTAGKVVLNVFCSMRTKGL